MINLIAQKIGLPTIVSRQSHGASLDKGRDYFSEIISGGYSRVITVEMPGPNTEARLRSSGIEMKIIDHHNYTGLDRAHDSHGNVLLSSLEQFLKMFRITDACLKKMGLDPLLVHGIGIQDRGFIWALQKEGYSRSQIGRVMDYHDELISLVRDSKTEANKKQSALRAWKRRKKWKEFIVIETRSKFQLRPQLSRVVAQKIGKPTALIIVDETRALIYVQESALAPRLFDCFGGFTFGSDMGWGYRNSKFHKKVTLFKVKKEIDRLTSNKF